MVPTSPPLIARRAACDIHTGPILPAITQYTSPEVDDPSTNIGLQFLFSLPNEGVQTSLWRVKEALADRDTRITSLLDHATKQVLERVAYHLACKELG